RRTVDDIPCRLTCRHPLVVRDDVWLELRLRHVVEPLGPAARAGILQNPEPRHLRNSGCSVLLLRVGRRGHEQKARHHTRSDRSDRHPVLRMLSAYRPPGILARIATGYNWLPVAPSVASRTRRRAVAPDALRYATRLATSSLL